MDAESCLKNVVRYNEMAEGTLNERVETDTVQHVERFIKESLYKNSILINTDGSLAIELSNPFKLDMYEEIVFRGEDISHYKENLAIGKEYGEVKLTYTQALIKVSIYNDYLLLSQLLYNKENDNLFDFIGNELLNYLNPNSSTIFILDLQGLSDIPSKELEEMVNSYMGDNVYSKLSSIVIKNADKVLRTKWFDFVNSYKGR